MKKFLLFICLIIYVQSFAQIKPVNGYSITINTENLVKEKFLLYLVYGTKSQIVMSDSITIKSNNQKIVFKKTDKLIGAIYYLKIASQKNALELAIDNNTNINLSLKSNNIETVSCNGNALNKDFINYQIQIKNANDSEKIALRKSLISKYPNTILSYYFTLENKIIETFINTTSPKNDLKTNLLKNFNKLDSRNYLLPNINRFLFTYVLQSPIDNENYIKNIDTFLKGVDCKLTCYQVYARWFLANYTYFEAKNLDLAFNHLFKNYIEKNTCKLFQPAEIAGLRNKYETHLLFPYNKVIPELNLVDKQNNEFILSKNYPNFDYTFLAFYSPTCNHCKETMPFANETFTKLKNKFPNKKFQLLAIMNDREATDWDKFITERKISNWTHLTSKDPLKSYQKDFNAYSNPIFFLIDKNGKVLLKSFNPMAIEELVK